MSVKQMKLGRADTCSMCATSLEVGTKAEWNAKLKQVTCLECVSQRGPAPNVSDVASTADDSVTAPNQAPPERIGVVAPTDRDSDELDVGVPGASARNEHAKRADRHNKRIEEKWGTGIAGKIAKVVSEEPQHTKSWKSGAVGEERLAQIITKRLGNSAVLLHDRKVPRTRGNIDHIAIAPSGVWVIDAKHYKGKVERRDKGGFFKTDFRLYVGGRDQMQRITGMDWQRKAVHTALADSAEIPVHCAVTFVNAEWPLFRKPLTFDEVTVCWPGKLADLIAEPGPLSAEEVQTVALTLAQRLPSVK